MSDVSVVIVSYHTGPALWLAIGSVLEQPECKELLLVDNGNVPNVLKRLEERAAKEPRLKLITGQGNIGFAKACNLGARAATGNYLLLLNPDSMLPQGGLAKALEVLKHYPENTLAGCYLVNPDGSEQRGCRRAVLTPKNAVAESLKLEKFIGKEEQLNFRNIPMPEAVHEVPAISGAFMMMPRAFYTQLGGLDEGYFLHMEDMDLCLRVHKAGGKVVCMPEVKVIHFRSTSEVSSAVVERHKARSFIRYLKLHYATQPSSFFLAAMAVGIWLRYMLLAIMGAVDRIFVPPLVAKREVARIVLLYRLTRFSPHDTSLAGKTILVTAGSGQVGLCAVGQALARGARVIATYHETVIPFSHPNLTWMQRDLTKPLLDIKADALIHAGALWMLPQWMDGVLDAGMIRIIAFGSTSVFTKTNSKNLYEQDIVDKLKKAEEDVTRIASAKGGNVTILRPTMIYGVGLDANLSRMADVIRRFGMLPVYGSASGLRQPVQAPDLAKAALDIIDNAATFNRSYNVGGSQTMTYLTMVTLLFKFVGKKLRIIRPPYMPNLLDILGKVYQVGHVNGEMARRMNQDLVFDIREAVADFGYKPQAFLQGDVEL